MRKLFYLYIILLPIMQVPQFAIIAKKIQYSEVVFLLFLALFLVASLRKKIKWVKTYLYIPMGFYLLIHLLSTFNASDILGSLLEIAGVIYLIVIFFVVINLISTRELLHKVLISWTIALAAVILCALIGLIEVYIFKHQVSLFMLSYLELPRHQLMHRIIPRVISTFRSPNMLMSYLVISAGLLIGFWEMAKKKMLRISLAVLLSVSFFVSLFTASRGVLAFLVCLVIATAIFKNRQRLFLIIRPFFAFSAVLLLIILAVLTVWEPSRVIISDANISGGRNISVDFHRTNKSYYYKYALAMIKDHPFIGIGSGNFNQRLGKYYYQDEKRDPYFKDFITYDPHSTYLGLAAEIGLLGLLSFLSIIFLFLKYMFDIFKRSQDRYISNLALGIIAGVIGILVQAMAMDIQNLRHLWLVLGLGVSLGNIQSTIKER